MIITILDTILNSMYTLVCVFFVLPLKKLKWWQITGAVALILAIYYFMKAEFNNGNAVIAGALEFVGFVVAPVLLCKGDPWRNVLIRMVFQLLALAFYYVIEYGAWQLFLKDVVSEKWFDGLTQKGMEGILLDLAFSSVEVILVGFIMRKIVRRWPKGHKKIYTWVVMLYLIAGMASGAVKVSEYIKSGGLTVLALLLTFLPCIGLGALISAVYSRTEKNRLRKENSWYERRITDMERSLLPEGCFTEYLRQKVELLEQKGIRVNCVEMSALQHLPMEYEMLMDGIFAWIEGRSPDFVRISVRGRDAMCMLRVSLEGENLTETEEEEVNDLELLSRRLNGTLEIDGGELSVLVFVEDGKELAG